MKCTCCALGCSPPQKGGHQSFCPTFLAVLNPWCGWLRRDTKSDTLAFCFFFLHRERERERTGRNNTKTFSEQTPETSHVSTLHVLNAESISSLFLFLYGKEQEGNKLKQMTTFNGGSLGSCIDEERSKLRYVMWIAELVNHRIFERNLRSWVFPGACLFEYRLLPFSPPFFFPNISLLYPQFVDRVLRRNKRDQRWRWDFVLLSTLVKQVSLNTDAEVKTQKNFYKNPPSWWITSDITEHKKLQSLLQWKSIHYKKKERQGDVSVLGVGVPFACFGFCFVFSLRKDRTNQTQKGGISWCGRFVLYEYSHQESLMSVSPCPFLFGRALRLGIKDVSFCELCADLVSACPALSFQWLVLRKPQLSAPMTK
jgi:hypothetical protein